VDRAISPADGYFDRVLKCVPVEVTSVYVVLLSAAGTAFDGTTLRWWTFLLFAFGLIAVPTYARMALGIRRSSQQLMTTVAFLVIVAVSGGWFATFSWWSGYYALLVTVVFGVSVALLDFGPARPRAPRTRTASPPAGEQAPAPSTAPAPAPRESPEPATGLSPEEEDSAVLQVWRGVDPPGSVRP
jgi:hypothetical protein